MSLLLDALRRAAAAKQGEGQEQDTLPRRSGSRRWARESGAGAADDADAALTLEPEPLDAAPAPGAAAPAGPAAAQAVFRSKQRRPGRGRAIVLGLLAIVAVAAALGAGGWYYYTTAQHGVSQQLSRYQPDTATGGRAPGADDTAAARPVPDGGEPGAGGERAADDGTPVEDAGSARTEPAGAADEAAAGDAQRPQPEAAEPGADDTAAGDEAGDEATETAQEPTAAGDAAPAASAQSPAPARRSEADASGAGTDAGGSDDGASEARAAAQPASSGADAQPASRTAVAADAASSGEAAAEPRRAQAMVRRSEGSPLRDALEAGYAALQAGRLERAAEAYGRALQLAPDNRDALLGAAAVAQRRGEPGRARSLYRRVLADRPRDPYARAALASLEGGGDPRRSETELKMLLRENPDAAALHFALGNVYARETRWAEAQQAYFEATRGEPDNPDYAYNLAVALDHLGQREAARRHYARALELAEGRPADFRSEVVRRRLAQLE